MSIGAEPSVWDVSDDELEQVPLTPDRDPLDTIYKVPGDSDFGSYEWVKDGKLGVIGASLIQKYANIKHLECFDVEYYWRKRGGNVKRRKHYGDTQVTNGLFRQELEIDYVIWLAADHCQGMTKRQIMATLYEQLCRAGIDKDGNRCYLSPDVSTFTAVVKEFGPQTAEQRYVGRVFQQLPLIPGQTVDTGDEEE